MSESSALGMYLEVVKSCEAEYGQLTEIFQVIDSKAQATAATAGIFLAAAFAFVQSLTVRLSPLHTSFLIASIGLLQLAVFFAVLGMWVQNVMGRPMVEFVQKLFLDLVKAEGSVDAIGARAAGFYGDQVSEWIPALQRMRTVVKRKSRFLACSQLSLLLALVSVSVLTIMFIAEGA